MREFNRLVEKFQKQQQVAISKTKLFVAQAENLASSSQSQLSQLEGPQGEQEPLLQQQKYTPYSEYIINENL